MWFSRQALFSYSGFSWEASSMLLQIAAQMVSQFSLEDHTVISAKKLLTWYELLPVVSFLLQKGHCRSCHTRLSFWYPFSEVLTGATLACVYLSGVYQTPLQLFFLLALSLCLLAVFFADWKHGIIPFPVVAVALFLSLAFFLTSSPQIILSHIVAGIGTAACFLAIYLFTKGGGMGFGDVVFAFFMGFLLGFPVILPALYLAFLTGALVSLILILAGKKKLHGGTIPFGPFLVLGTFVLLLWEKQVTDIIHLFF